ncbi:enoyl-CoA hydratase/isomerase family protein [Hoeflea prorocentri]|uniref:3-hydroxyisobutyryl-CoA hydrolase n=1 Tax=Hoeflea prorocentri TaxID=1922333 RepID=A0A9X3UI50_9HYPH|nr:enoyl-CoA hydratase/isomerase family protein [Hoeflea prorocentri]MCY6381250.1 enoyl-CoA hydratase/isomerase family protein [Hoeflea prorocentri]MDA5399050.1 enoyl-CoA hydratase/isomerase family protein [Hoeflea prorocentri]
MDFGGDGDVAFEVRGHAGIISLTRPDALNAINHKMVRAMDAALDAWQSDDRVTHIILKGEGRAFSAGGDLLELYRMSKSGRPHYDFFRDEYLLNARLGVYPKPVVPMIDGIIMGGGVGVAVHGPYRVMTENAVFAMPEVGIGFFPDVGGSHFLSRLPGHFGLFLALTGTRIRAGDALASGIATHALPAEGLDALEDDLCKSPDTASVLDRHDNREALPAAKLDHKEIGRLFSGRSVIEVVEELGRSAPDSEFAAKTLAAIGRNSPTSMSVAFRQLLEGVSLSLADCMRMEYRILVRMLQGHEFIEGIRAVIVDKTNDPTWNPARLEDVSADAVDAYFAHLNDDELTGFSEVQ